MRVHAVERLNLQTSQRDLPPRKRARTTADTRRNDDDDDDNDERTSFVSKEKKAPRVRKRAAADESGADATERAEVVCARVCVYVC